MKETYYFAYGSNMNLDQMAYRCPAASVVEPVYLEGYRLTFCGRGKGSGVATILPEEGSRVEGVLWKITPECEKSLDFYEGYPHLYGKEPVLVQGKDGMKREVMAYTMNAPYKDQPAIPSDLYGDCGRLPSKWDFQPLCDRCVKTYKTGSGQTKNQSKENRSKQITKPQGKASAVFLTKKGECNEEQKYQNKTCSLRARIAHGS